MKATRVEASEMLEDAIAEQAIRKAIFRIARGTDRRDLDLVRSGYHPDAIDDHGGSVVEGRFEGPVDGYIEWLRTNASTESSMHYISNVLVEREGDTAWVESYVLALLRLAVDDGAAPVDRQVKLRYFDRFERRAGEWRIARRRVIYTGGRDDVVERDAPPQAMGLVGHRGPEDPTYDRSWPADGGAVA